MDRRAFIVGGVAAVMLPVPAKAQPVGRTHRLGVLSPDTPPPGLLETVREELRQLGHIEGKTLIIEGRTAAGRTERLSALADELVRLKVDVILTINTSAALAAKNATKSVPIVITRVADPVRSGLVPSLSRPNGNVTGVTFLPEVIAVKGLELLKEALPRLSRAAALFHADNPGSTIVVGEMERAAAQLSMTLRRLPIKTPADLPGIFETATQYRTEAIVVVDDAMVTKHRGEIVSGAIKLSIPVLSEYKPFVEVGGLIAYGPSTVLMYKRAAHYVDKILRGTKPADLPIEQPTKFDLFINLKTAKALGLTIPPSLLLRADQVIE